MKNYFCAILLMCGVAHFATQVQGDCLYESILYSVGVHTTPSCVRLTCFEDGGIGLVRCPLLIDQCKRPNDRFVGYTFEEKFVHFPACCPRPICKSI